MTKYLIKDTTLTEIADAIRTTSGKSEPIFVTDMASEILDISGTNFKVVGGTIEPENPTENTIWVNTYTTITSYIFSATEPEEYAKGMVWISTGTSSSTEFNALKKNSIQVYPLFAKQYVSGAWVSKTAKCYQGGIWTTLISEILRNGVLNANVGNWVPLEASAYSNGIISANLDYNKGNNGWFENKIKVAGFNKLVFRCKVTSIYTDTLPMHVGITLQNFSDRPSYADAITRFVASAEIKTANSVYTEYEVQLGNIPDSEYYITVLALATYEIDGIWFE